MGEKGGRGIPGKRPPICTHLATSCSSSDDEILGSATQRGNLGSENCPPFLSEGEEGWGVAVESGHGLVALVILRPTVAWPPGLLVPRGHFQGRVLAGSTSFLPQNLSGEGCGGLSLAAEADVRSGV